MKDNLIKDAELAKNSVNWRSLKLVSAVMALIGAAAFVYGAFSGTGTAWQAYLVNFVFWTGLSAGAFLLSPILVTTGSHWGRPVKRLAEAAGSFLPVSFLLFWVLFAGREEIFPWIRHPVEEKAKLIWLNVPFLFIRDGAALLILALLFVWMTYYSVRADREAMLGQGEGADRLYRGQTIIAPIFIIMYAFILTLIAFDLIMSLNPHWVSTLFGAYYFVGSFYMGLAALILICAFAAERMGLGGYIAEKQFFDLGKLLFGFCIVSLDFFYVQFLVIYYGNLPEETRYVITRVWLDPWAFFAWLVLFACYVIPFVVLLLRKIKMVTWMISAMSVWILIAMWLERFFLVVPSISKSKTIPLGWMEFFVSMGFLGIFVFCTAWFLERYPVMAVSDPLMSKALEVGEHQIGLAGPAQL